MKILLTTCETGAGMFEGLVNGTVIVRSRQPIYDGARALLKLGHDPEELLRVRREGRDSDVIDPAPIGGLAKWTVSETDKGGMRLRLWEPYCGRRVSPPVDAGGQKVVQVPG